MIETKHCSKKAAFALEPIQLQIGASAVSQTAKRAGAFTAQYPFQVVAVEAYGLTVTATTTVDVQIGATSVLNAQITPTADALVQGVLSPTLANLQGAKGAVISLKYTTNGSGAITNGFVTVWIRPLGMKGDPTPMQGEQA